MFFVCPPFFVLIFEKKKMGKHHPPEIKKLLVKFYEENNLTYAALGRKFDMSASSVRDIINRFKKTGSTEGPGSGGSRGRKTTPVDDRQILVKVKKNPFVTLR